MLADRYVIDHEIGRWDLGPVWLGLDTVLDRAVDLKQVSPTAGDPSTDVARAAREAHLTARVHHENVVAVLDLVEDGGHHWLVTEHVEGTSLADLIDERGTIAPDDLAPVLEQVADALATAHQHGVVHRAVRPTNIVIASDGSAKLTDFGAASGTTVDATATDVWSLGRTAFQALSGHLPDDAGSVSQLDDADALTPIVGSMLLDDPSARPTMADVHRAASRLLPVGDVPARSAPDHAAPDQAGTDWRTLGAALAAALLLVLAVVLGSVLGSDVAFPAQAASASTSQTSATSPDAVLEGFATDYLTAASNDPRKGFALLTPAFRTASGGFEKYEGFWTGVSRVNVERVTGDAANGTVSYTYSYDVGGERVTKSTTLELERSGGSYLVAGAS